nr:integrase, catalytic region, zinc finger, CCHC-type, peptidase aspartic, catalytic [Tanacetum cinerariifolium]
MYLVHSAIKLMIVRTWESYNRRLTLVSSLTKAFWIYNRRTRRFIETIHVDFDELSAMASEQSSSRPALHEMTPATISSGLVSNTTSSTASGLRNLVIGLHNCEPVDAAGSGATTSAIGAMTSGAG